MPRDHYIAQTYLKHFLGTDGVLHAYSKPDGRYFPCRPRDICHEWHGDIIRDFLSHPELLGRYRKIFEPTWNPAMGELLAGRVSRKVKMAIAGYLANLLVCNPAWTRVGVKFHNYHAMHRLRASDALKTEHGKPDSKLKELLTTFDSSRLRLDTKPDAIRAMLTRDLMRYAWVLYNSNWIVTRNETDTDFLTSDNPVAFDDPGPWRGGLPELPRYVPLTPTRCLLCFMNPAGRYESKPNFSQQPQGRIRFGTIPLRGVRLINRAVVQCAENLVISSQRLPSVEALVKKYARHRVDVDFIDIRQGDAFRLGVRTRVREAREAETCP